MQNTENQIQSILGPATKEIRAPRQHQFSSTTIRTSVGQTGLYVRFTEHEITSRTNLSYRLCFASCYLQSSRFTHHLL